MGKVIAFPTINIKRASTAQLKKEWDLWMESDEEEIHKVPGVEFRYEDIHAELNRRGEGEHCAV